MQLLQPPTMVHNSASNNVNLKVCVIGAGVAGLTFAQVLLRRAVGVHLIIHEREVSQSARTQGGSLDLKADGGQIALKLAGLFEEFQQLMRSDGQSMKIVQPSGKLLFHHVDDGDDFNPEIDRSQLRAMFLDRLGQYIRWGSHVTSIEPESANSDGSGSDPTPHGSNPHKYRVNLADGSSESFDLVVGADGCFSQVRPLLSNAKALYTGYTFTECYLSDVARRYPNLNALIGPGSLMIPATGGKAILAQQNGDGKLRVYAVLQVPEDWSRTNGFPWEDDPTTTRKLLLEYYTPGPESQGADSASWHNWSPDLLDLIKLSDDTFRPWPLYALPINHEWDHKRGLTLIGDAAHVMSPFAGEGANIAMLDGAKLAEAIADSVDSAGVHDNPDHVVQEPTTTGTHAEHTQASRQASGSSDRQDNHGIGSSALLSLLDQKVQVFEREMFNRAHAASMKSDRNMRQFLGSKEDVETIIAQWQKMFQMIALGGRGPRVVN